MRILGTMWGVACWNVNLLLLVLGSRGMSEVGNIPQYIFTVTHLMFLYILEWTGSPVSLAMPVSSVYTHVPPILPICSNAVTLNRSGNFERWLRPHSPAGPAPMIATFTFSVMCCIYEGQATPDYICTYVRTYLNNEGVASCSSCDVWRESRIQNANQSTKEQTRISSFDQIIIVIFIILAVTVTFSTGQNS